MSGYLKQGTGVQGKQGGCGCQFPCLSGPSRPPSNGTEPSANARSASNTPCARNGAVRQVARARTAPRGGSGSTTCPSTASGSPRSTGRGCRSQPAPLFFFLTPPPGFLASFFLLRSPSLGSLLFVRCLRLLLRLVLCRALPARVEYESLVVFGLGENPRPRVQQGRGIVHGL